MVKRAIVVLAWAGSWLSCSFDAAPTGLAVCVDGQSTECACEGGPQGLQTCSDGAYGACVCGPASGTSPASGGGEGGAGTSSGGPGAGSNGSSSSSAGADGSTDGGSGGSGSSSGGAGGGSAGTAGSSAEGGSGGSGGSAGSGTAGDGSAGAAGNTGSAGTDGGDAGSGGGGDPAAPGTLYGACAAQGDCHDGRVCYTVSSNGAVTGYCTPSCTVGGSGGFGTCQQPESGEVRAQCTPLLGLCLLGSCENADCPAGMDCVETALPFGQAGNSFDCRYPVQ